MWNRFLCLVLGHTGCRWKKHLAQHNPDSNIEGSYWAIFSIDKHVWYFGVCERCGTPYLMTEEFNNENAS